MTSTEAMQPGPKGSHHYPALAVCPVVVCAGALSMDRIK